VIIIAGQAQKENLKKGCLIIAESPPGGTGLLKECLRLAGLQSFAQEGGAKSPKEGPASFSAAPLSLEPTGETAGDEERLTASAEALATAEALAAEEAAAAINAGLFKNLKVDPYRVNSLPPGWSSGEAASAARQEIEALLEKYLESPGAEPLILTGPLYSRTLLLWLAALDRLKIPERVIISLRHPAEAARELKEKADLEPASGYLSWLTFYREAKAACRGRLFAMAALEELLEDPGGLLARLAKELHLEKALPRRHSLKLLYRVQRAAGKHKLPEEEKIAQPRYRAFNRLYELIFPHISPGETGVCRALARSLKEALRVDLLPSLGIKQKEFYRLPARLPEAVADYPRASGSTCWGVPLMLISREMISAEIYACGLYKPDLSAVFKQLIRPGATVFDVGAHLGYFSLLAAALAGDRGEVIAFEAAPPTFEILQENLRSYPRAKVVPHPLWDEVTTIDFKVFEAPYAAYNTVVADKLSREEKKNVEFIITRLQTTTLDRYCSEHGPVPDLVKLDVESSEMRVLRGMSGLLETVRPVITLESGDLEEPDHPDLADTKELIRYLGRYDYRAFAPGAYRLREYRLPVGLAEPGHLVMIPAEKVPPEGVF